TGSGMSFDNSPEAEGSSFMGTNLPSSDVQVLHSWKEIASYTGRGVRTLQRYEACLGFPIHRPLGKPRSSVLAFKHEIDQWLEKTPVDVQQASEKVSIAPAEALRGAESRLEALYQRVMEWRSRTESMQQRLASMRNSVNFMQENLTAMLERVETTQRLVWKSKSDWEQVSSARQRKHQEMHSQNMRCSASAAN